MANLREVSSYVSSYVVEVTRPQLRGFAMSFNQFAYNFGVCKFINTPCYSVSEDDLHTVLSFWVSLGTVKVMPVRDNWRTISAIQCLWGILVIVAAFFAPESPRQLLVREEN